MSFQTIRKKLLEKIGIERSGKFLFCKKQVLTGVELPGFASSMGVTAISKNPEPSKKFGLSSATAAKRQNKQTEDSLKKTQKLPQAVLSH